MTENMNVGETGVYLGWGVGGVFRRRNSGERLPPSVKIGRREVFRRADVDAFKVWLDSLVSVRALAEMSGLSRASIYKRSENGRGLPPTAEGIHGLWWEPEVAAAWVKSGVALLPSPAPAKRRRKALRELTFEEKLKRQRSNGRDNFGSVVGFAPIDPPTPAQTAVVRVAIALRAVSLAEMDELESMLLGDAA